MSFISSLTYRQIILRKFVAVHQNSTKQPNYNDEGNAVNIEIKTIEMKESCPTPQISET